MKFLALEKEIPGTAESSCTPALLRRESARAWELTQQGIFREMYFRSDTHEAIIVLEADSIESARSALQSLPLMKAGLIDFDVAPLVPYDGFARLFSQQH